MATTNAYYPAGSDTGHWARHPDDIWEFPQLFKEVKESTPVTEHKFMKRRVVHEICSHRKVLTNNP
jgi:hypothetical protein